MAIERILKINNSWTELFNFHVGKAAYYCSLKIILTIACNEVADSADQRSDCTFCAV